MKKRVDVKPEDVQVGDWVKVRGFGRYRYRTEAAHFNNSVLKVASFSRYLIGVMPHPNDEVDEHSCVWIVDLNIIEAWREVEEEPQPGTWQSLHNDQWGTCECGSDDRRKDSSYEHRVYRAGSGWSKDTRTKDERFAVGRPALAVGFGSWDAQTVRLNGMVEIENRDMGAFDIPGLWRVTFGGRSAWIHQSNLTPIERRKVTR